MKASGYMFAAIWLYLAGGALGLVALGWAALRWGSDSSDGHASPEWERRQRWYGGQHWASGTRHDEP